MRVGHGFDVHAFHAGRKLVLGGVTIPHHMGLLAHSDGDVVIHALCDALLGAACLGDIGRHFPDNQTAYKDIDSRQLLRRVVMMLKEREYSINNVDITVIAQAPKLADHIEVMRKNLSFDMDTDLNRVNIKATTTEKLGYIGREEGIATHAVILLAEK